MAASMTLRPASRSAEMSDEEMLPEHDEISNDEENRTTQSSEGPVSKVAVRQGLNIHPGVSKCTELIGVISVIDAVDAKLVSLNKREIPFVQDIDVCASRSSAIAKTPATNAFEHLSSAHFQKFRIERSDSGFWFQACST